MTDWLKWIADAVGWIVQRASVLRGVQVVTKATSVAAPHQRHTGARHVPGQRLQRSSGKLVVIWGVVALLLVVNGVHAFAPASSPLLPLPFGQVASVGVGAPPGSQAGAGQGANTGRPSGQGRHSGATPTPTPLPTPPPALAIPAYPGGPERLFTQAACTPVYATTSSQDTWELATLMGGSDVTAQGSAHGWTRVTFWSGVTGYLPDQLGGVATLARRAPAVAVDGDCAFRRVPPPAPDVLPTATGPYPIPAQTQVIATQATTLYSQPDHDAIPLTGIGQGAHLAITAWASDAQGFPWYRTSMNGQTGWAPSDAVRVVAPAPSATQVAGHPGHPVWAPVAGKGMWFTNDQTRHADLPTLVHAAQQAGVTHLYVEVAITEWGFFAPTSLDRILPVAHAAHLPVIAWVYPTLDNVGDDVRMTQQVATYHTPSGDRADGIVTDVETTVDPTSVYTFGQLLRALLGPDELLVDSALNPVADAQYPYAQVAASWNVIAPMDYWHGLPNHVYSASDVRRFVTNSVTTIRQDITQGGMQLVPIEETGQTYDMYSQDGTDGGNSPTWAEITADMQTAHDLGCIAVSFFEWQTTIQPEWEAFDTYSWL